MKHTNSIFHQLLQFLPRQRFQSVVDRHKADHRTRSLTCWDQLVALLFAQLSGRKSLRDLVDTSIVNMHIIITLVAMITYLLLKPGPVIKLLHIITAKNREADPCELNQSPLDF